MRTIKLVATDLDGTFLRNDKTISSEDLRMLNLLGEREIVRVAATGRNLQKVKEVLSPEVPFDYIAFSSGAGIYNWKNHRLLYRQNLSKDTANKIIKILISQDLNFHLFHQVPNNHKCWYFRGSQPCMEFERYFEFHHSFSEPIPESQKIEEDVCQFLVIFPNQPELFHRLKEELHRMHGDIKIVRASSPIGTGYIWMEIFHQDVSKGNAIRFLCDQIQIHPNETLGIGNDYNDLDLLDFTSISYLVANAPDEMKAKYLSAPSNEEDAFSISLKNHL
ncbi:HAD family hydrolase [Sunxiuqinia sp. A32]|uniref:HAD family hydrolase n=1 Tax=Sunxiuqinia sp. A32 TaxID=3461496 RepID=UPI0040454A25